MADLARLTVEDFAARLGDRFTHADGTAFELVEATAHDGSGRHDPDPRMPFSLVFAGPPGAVRPQGILALTHPQLGTLEIFLVPIEADATAVRYEAVFG
jgi:hypothetical protein